MSVHRHWRAYIDRHHASCCSLSVRSESPSATAIASQAGLRAIRNFVEVGHHRDSERAHEPYFFASLRTADSESRLHSASESPAPAVQRGGAGRAAPPCPLSSPIARPWASPAPYCRRRALQAGTPGALAVGRVYEPASASGASLSARQHAAQLAGLVHGADRRVRRP